MKYFVVADVHGFYDLMIAELNKAGFDPANPNHTLVSLGDAFDRGDKPLQVMKYFNSLPRKILVRGNHEDLMQRALREGFDFGIDIPNGTFDTVVAVANHRNKQINGNSISRNYAMMAPDLVIDFMKNAPDYQAYMSSLVDYFETEHYIFIHGWIPTECRTDLNAGKMIRMYKYQPDWRNASKKEWDNARWSSGVDCTRDKAFEPGKTIVCGHWHCSAWHDMFEGAIPFSNFAPYKSAEVIACDACTAYSNRINVVVLED